MSVVAERKRELVEKFGAKEGDSGSSEVQIAVLSWRINSLRSHFNEHPKDNHSRRGLLALVSKRRSLLRYLERRNYARYRAVISELGLRR